MASLKNILPILQRLRKEGKRIVFTNGCFDLLHPGHIHLLKEARRLGDILVVGLNTGASVRRLKGAGRPVHNQRDRAQMLKALRPVDYVVPFGEDTPLKLIRAIRPDVLVKGADYPLDRIVGGEFSGRVVRIPLKKGHSTTAILKKLAQ